MGRPFRRSRGEVIGAFHVVEADLLRSLLGQLLDLVRVDPGPIENDADPLSRALGVGVSDRPPEDPVLARLFPDGYRDDREASADFRRYTEQGLRAGKTRNVEQVLACLGGGTVQDDRVTMHLDDESCLAWLRVLTDLRLALGVRLGVAEGDERRWAELPDDDPAAQVHEVYEWLGWVQEMLVRTRRPRAR